MCRLAWLSQNVSKVGSVNLGGGLARARPLAVRDNGVAKREHYGIAEVSVKSKGRYQYQRAPSMVFVSAIYKYNYNRGLVTYNLRTPQQAKPIRHHESHLWNLLIVASTVAPRVASNGYARKDGGVDRAGQVLFGNIGHSRDIQNVSASNAGAILCLHPFQLFG